MEKPWKYFVICLKTKELLLETNILPSEHSLQTYEPTTDPKIRKLKVTKEVWENTRYEAQLRLYNYLTYTKQGKPVPRYEPYKGTEIGKSIPILNF